MVKLKSLNDIYGEEVVEDEARVHGEKNVWSGEDDIDIENCNRRIRRQEEVENKNEMDIHQETHGSHQTSRTGISGGKLNDYLSELSEMMGISSTSTSHSCEIPTSDMRILNAHGAQVFACAWSPSASFLASGCLDSTIRIWTISNGTYRSSLQSEPPSNVLVLKHASELNDGPKHVPALDWNNDGTLLGTGSCDGKARIWSTCGKLKSTLNKHTDAILKLKWNKNNTYILTAGYDCAAIVWDVNSSKVKQEFRYHSGSVSDVDWRDNDSFATCSGDCMVHVCNIRTTYPIKKFSGHQEDVNCVKWDPTGSLLASCSDDKTVKEVYVIRWRPAGPGTNNSNQPSTLASASFDSTVKLWDVENGKLLCSLNEHRDLVYGLAFSPNGEYLASGSADGSIHIWSLKEREIIKSYTGDSGVLGVCWNNEGDKVAASLKDGTICILNIRI
ncbi:hypothetical protein BUALT_Bualt16G0037800 [Buddleja alternifolia]|uniref:Uncharacterized protein n=1 Tax=Buddleja alternifolia TaxID=168488 RepID=A0AAV6WJN7_9LAMI|nr:hypothetical protein BUALT_Bualt16G0037800 [Buddleja alternifolia]